MNDSYQIKCVLVVQKDPSIFQKINDSLKKDGFHCDHSTTAEQALTMMNHHYYDLIISDIELPDMDGIHFIKTLKKDSPHRDIIIIISEESKFDTIEVLKNGAMDLVPYPFRIDYLKAAIYKADKNRQLFKDLAHIVPKEAFQQINDQEEDMFEKTDDHLVMDQDQDSSEKIDYLTMVCHQQLSRLKHEINKRKIATLALQSSKNKLNAHLEQTPLSYIEWTLDFQLEYLNHSAEELFGYPLCEIKGTHFFDTIKSRSDEANHSMMDRFMMKNVKKDGSFVYCRWFNTPLSGPDNQILGIASIVEDTTELFNANKEIMEALTAKEEFLNKLKYEYNVASTILSKVMKQTKQDFPHVKFLRRSMEIACGDLALAFDKPSGGVYIFMGDFTGHGLAAAIGAIPVVDILIEMTSKNSSIDEILHTLNLKIKNTMPTGKFLAATLFEYSFATGILKVWNGGNPDVIIVDAKGVKKRFPSTHLPLGVLDYGRDEFIPEEFQTIPNDRVYSFSDGIIETFNANEEMLGIERFEHILTHIKNPEESILHISREIDSFRGDIYQQDDVTLVELTCVKGVDVIFKPIKDMYHNYEGWKINLKLDAAHLRQNPGIPELLIQSIENDVILLAHKESIFIIMQEMVSNALDYGLLKLDPDLKKSLDGYDAFFTQRLQALHDLQSGWIEIFLEYRPSAQYSDVVIQVEDSGLGFNYPEILENLKNNLSFSGRGLALIKSLSHEIIFMHSGNCIRAIYRCKNN